MNRGLSCRKSTGNTGGLDSCSLQLFACQFRKRWIYADCSGLVLFGFIAKGNDFFFGISTFKRCEVDKRHDFFVQFRLGVGEGG
jgi:hypothetical protein